MPSALNAPPANPAGPLRGRFGRTLLAVAAFALPALSLGAPSGYSWGALLLVMAGLSAWGLARPSQTSCRALAAFAVATGIMAVVWFLRHDFDAAHPWQPAAFEHAAKYLVALLAIPALCRFAPPLPSILWGCWVGAWLAGGIAAWQVFVLGLPRAHGFTNAIPFGNIALLLAAWSAIGWPLARSRAQRLALVLAVAMGMFASLASGSRGGWVIAPALLAIVWLTQPKRAAGPEPGAAQPTLSWRTTARPRTLAGLALILGLLLSTQWAQITTRLGEIDQEVAAYFERGEADTSIGQRLAHWQLAWQLGLEKPWLGWGKAGYEAEKNRRVAAGDAPTILLDFGNAHHEWLDLWAKGGLVGVAALAAFYGVPGWLYWRARRRAAAQLRNGPDPRGTVCWLAASCGLVTVVGFLGFGLTHKLLTYNASNIVYLFMNLLWLGVIAHTATPRRIEGGCRQDTI
ncbi:O-Antigen ligase [Tepidimonas thermarum]|uniref:O-Antigen ligase n=1 Tax=Tepidimonas thermarum TaxID=335431 RepID=A0A554WYX2_9BURK|nr:O-Antigen ligase [Tepidimonas thermarum]